MSGGFKKVAWTLVASGSLAFAGVGFTAIQEAPEAQANPCGMPYGMPYYSPCQQQPVCGCGGGVGYGPGMGFGGYPGIGYPGGIGGAPGIFDGYGGFGSRPGWG
jgi:hypothetical protein